MSARPKDAISPREQEVLEELAGQATNAEIAERLFISVRTVESHIASLLRKTGAHDRRALAAMRPPVDAGPRRPPVSSTLTSFVGRAAEREALAAALAEHRLVTALGPGGVGKTRLAYIVAGDVVERYPDGVWIVDLVPVTDPDRIAATVADRIGVHERQGRSVLDALEAWLSPRTALLVLDNCEHLLDPVAAFLERLLAACPGVTVLATSRSRLAVPFEWVFVVPGLSAGPDGDAAALFEARALAAGVPVTDAERPRIAGTCAALEGMALAIELAVARLPALGLDGLEAGLGDRLALLTGGGRADARHRSLRATVDWSHELLAPAERAVLRRVSVFASPFTAAAAADVAGGLPDGLRAAVPAALAALVDGNLLDAVRAPAGTRYRALETIRQYGAERLEAEGETAAVRAAHLDWCLRTAEALGVEPRDDERWSRDVDSLSDEARSALARGTVPETDRPAAHRLAERFARLSFARGAPGEAQRRFEQAAELAGDALTRARSLAAAAGAAEARQFGDAALLLRRRAATAFAQAGAGDAAAIELARVAETLLRFQGILTTPPNPAAVPPLLAEAAALAPGSPTAAARIALVELLAVDDADPGKEARALRLIADLESLDDRFGWSGALDALCAVRLVRGELVGASAAATARDAVLAPLGIRPELGLELTDALQMATECAIGIGDLPAADRLSRRVLTLPYHSREPHLATARAMLVTWLQGDLLACAALGERFLDGWERAGRPSVHNLAPSAAAACNAAELAGDDVAARRWAAVVRSLAVAEWSAESFEVLGFRLLAALHRGEFPAAHADTPDVPHLPPIWYAGLWRPWYAALRAESAVLAGAPDAAAEIDGALPLVEQNRVASALVDRARALLDGDAAALPPIADRLENQQARYQAARTRIMAGGALREQGEAEMAACGAAPMAWPAA